MQKRKEILSAALSSIVLIFSSILADALSDSPHQNTLILGFRYFAFGIMLLDIIIQSRAKEYPYPETEQTKLSNIMKKICQNKKFFYCLLLLFFWQFVCSANILWDYHLLNHLEFSYTLINSMYSVQFVPLMRGCIMVVFGVILVTKWRLFTHERDVAELEHYNAMLKKHRFFSNIE